MKPMGRRALEEKVLQKLSSKAVSFLAGRKVSPMGLTTLALFLALLSSVFYYLAAGSRPLYLVAAMLLLFSGILDAVDGAVARRLGRATRVGAFIDSTFDKVSEASVLVAIISSGAVNLLWGSVALSSSILVSYVRHRGELVGVEVKGVGVMERAERLITLFAGTILEAFIPGILNIAVGLIALLASVTVAQRIIHVVRSLSRRPS